MPTLSTVPIMGWIVPVNKPTFHFMSKKLAVFIERYPNMIAEYRAFVVDAIIDLEAKDAQDSKK